jgi:transposase-like protein
MTKLTLTEWRAVVDDLHRTKDPISLVADRHHVSVAQLAYWRRRVHDIDNASPSSLAVAFVEAKPFEESGHELRRAPFVVTLQNGTAISVQPPFQMDALRALLVVVNEVL